MSFSLVCDHDDSPIILWPHLAIILELSAWFCHLPVSHLLNQLVLFGVFPPVSAGLGVTF